RRYQPAPPARLPRGTAARSPRRDRSPPRSRRPWLRSGAAAQRVKGLPGKGLAVKGLAVSGLPEKGLAVKGLAAKDLPASIGPPWPVQPQFGPRQLDRVLPVTPRYRPVGPQRAAGHCRRAAIDLVDDRPARDAPDAVAPGHPVHVAADCLAFHCRVVRQILAAQ